MKPKKLGNLNKLSNIAKGVKEGAKGGMLTVHPDECYVEEQVRTKFEVEALEELGAAIAEEGQSTPCVVFPKDDRGYRIYNGERRWRSIKLKELQSIKIVVDPDLKLEEFEGKKIMPLSVKVGQASDNINRDDLTPFEIAQLIKELMEEPYKLKKGDIAKKFGKTAPWTSRHVKLLDAPDSVKSLCEDGLMMDAETLSQLTKLHEKSPSACEMLIKNGQYQRKNAEEALRSIKRNEERVSHVEETDANLKNVLDTWECNSIASSVGPEVTDFIKMIYTDHVIDSSGEAQQPALDALLELVQKPDMPTSLRTLRVEHGCIEDKKREVEKSSAEPKSIHSVEVNSKVDTEEYEKVQSSFTHGEYLLSIDEDLTNEELEQMSGNIDWIFDSLAIKDEQEFLQNHRELFSQNLKSLLSYGEIFSLIKKQDQKGSVAVTETTKVTTTQSNTEENKLTGWHGDQLVFNGVNLGLVDKTEAGALVELLKQKFGDVSE